MTELTAVVIESSYVLRKGWVSILRSLDSIHLVHEFSHTGEFIPLAAKYHPDIVFLNPRSARFEDMAEIPAKNIGRICWVNIAPKPATAPPWDQWFDEYLPMQADREEIENKLKPLFSKLDTGEAEGRNPGLSSREELVLKYVSLGFTNKEIGEKLFISPHTVISHRRNITRKLGIKTVAGLTVFAILNKIVSPADLKH